MGPLFRDLGDLETGSKADKRGKENRSITVAVSLLGSEARTGLVSIIHQGRIPTMGTGVNGGCLSA